MTSWFDCIEDVELLQLLEVLETIADVENVVPALENIPWPPTETSKILIDQLKQQQSKQLESNTLLTNKAQAGIIDAK